MRRHRTLRIAVLLGVGVLLGGCGGSSWSRSGGYGYSYSIYDDCHGGGAEDLGFYAAVIGLSAAVHAIFSH